VCFIDFCVGPARVDSKGFGLRGSFFCRLLADVVMLGHHGTCESLQRGPWCLLCAGAVRRVYGFGDPLWHFNCG
jgi:hypothetical protein